ncbi:MAG: DUF6263 family protein [Sedimentisphaerales bacterium]
MKNLRMIFTAETAKRAEVFLLFFLCGLGVLCGKAFCGELRFKFSPGDKYSLVLVTEQKSAQVVDGNEQTSEQTTRLECDFDIEEVDESGCAWVKYTHKRVTMKVRSPKQKIDYDSDANQLKTPMQVLPLRLAMGEGIYLRITPQGRIEKINGLQALITSAKAKMASFAGADKVGQSIAETFAEPTIKRELEDRLRIFPGPNEQGTTWSQTNILSPAEAGFGGPEWTGEVNIIYEKTFRLKSSTTSPAPASSDANLGGGQSGVAVVDVNLVIKTASAPVAGAPAPGTPMRNDLEVSGGGTGQIEIEEATGRIINSKITEDMTARLVYAAQGPMLRPPPPTEPITTHTVTTFQMTQREPPVPDKVEVDKLARPADANR